MSENVDPTGGSSSSRWSPRGESDITSSDVMVTFYFIFSRTLPGREPSPGVHPAPSRGASTGYRGRWVDIVTDYRGQGEEAADVKGREQA